MSSPAHSRSMRNGLEKVPQILSALLHPDRLTAVGWDLSQCSRNKKEKKILLNVYMLIYWGYTHRPHRCTALIASELARYEINVATLSETRLAGKRELTEKISSYSFFWNRHATNDKREARVSYAIKTSLVGKLTPPPPKV